MEIEIVEKQDAPVPLVRALESGTVFQSNSGAICVKGEWGTVIVMTNNDGNDYLIMKHECEFKRPRRILGRMVGIKVEPQ